MNTSNAMPIITPITTQVIFDLVLILATQLRFSAPSAFLQSR